MQNQELIIVNAEGFHVRPAQSFVTQANQFESDIKVKNTAGSETDGKSILGLMTLGLQAGSKVIIQASGPDEKEALHALAALIESGFGESK